MTTFNPLGLKLNFNNRTVDELVKDELVKKRIDSLEDGLAYLKNYNVSVSRESVLDELKSFKRIGRGGFGDVFIVKSKDNENAMALKRIQLASQKDIDEKLLQEVVINEKLTHQNIVGFYYYGVEFDKLNDTWLYLIMELCHEDLAQWFENEKQPRKHQECMKMFMNICEGIQYIHGKGFIHRDLKPKNILISMDKKVCKIADFGLARLHETRDGSVVQYYTHTAGKGTPVYAAPEQLANTNHGKKVDIFPLGLILIGFLIDAIDDKYLCSLLDQIREKSTLPNGLIRDEFVREDQLILDMTKTDPEDRPNIGQVIQQVNQIMKKIEEN